MKKTLLVCCALALTLGVQAQWKPVGDKIKTPWAEQVNPEDVLPEYPRPQLERGDWQNLNGEWEYAIKPVGEVEPATFDGKILVPFAVESSLSGVQKEVGEKNELWYKRTFSVPSAWKNKDIVLNFGAVDWKADVFVNDILIGSHKGGFTPFSFNITPYLTGKSNQKLVVRVWDPSDKGYQPRGKQIADPHGIWYTPVTGIWQTVWLEPVAAAHVTSVKSIPNIDNNTLNVTVGTSCDCNSGIVTVKLLDKGQVVASAKGVQGKELRLSVQNPTLWSPSNPYLYDMTVSLSKDGKVLDEVKSYTAFRKISSKRDAAGIMRMQLNNQDLFQFGPLDQGWWPDGLYTAPSYKAMVFDVDKTKDWGYNMIRKHIKVEPALWYTYCDRNGIIVWQDMPSGDKDPEWQGRNYFDGEELERTPESEANYRKEWREIMDCLYSYPCIAMWVPFNEAWGQFKTKEIADWTKNHDPSRLVNPASGGNFYPCGDILDVHCYPSPPVTHVYDAKRANVLGEYGGIGMVVNGHIWAPDREFSYINCKTPAELTDRYIGYANYLDHLAKEWFVGAVYTQTTDVEIEVNGLMTYDRKVIKIDEDRIREVNKRIIKNHSK